MCLSPRGSGLLSVGLSCTMHSFFLLSCITSHSCTNSYFATLLYITRLWAYVLQHSPFHDIELCPWLWTHTSGKKFFFVHILLRVWKLDDLCYTISKCFLCWNPKTSWCVCVCTSIWLFLNSENNMHPRFFRSFFFPCLHINMAFSELGKHLPTIFVLFFPLNAHQYGFFRTRKTSSLSIFVLFFSPWTRHKWSLILMCAVHRAGRRECYRWLFKVVCLACIWSMKGSSWRTIRGKKIEWLMRILILSRFQSCTRCSFLHTCGVFLFVSLPKLFLFDECVYVLRVIVVFPRSRGVNISNFFFQNVVTVLLASPVNASCVCLFKVDMYHI